MKVLVFGASGFVGTYLVQELQDFGHEVFQANLPEVNLLDVEAVGEAVRSAFPDAIVNLAAVSSVGASWKNPALTMDVNVKGTLHLLEAVHQYVPQCKTLLIGSAEEYAPKDVPLKESDELSACNPYGISKIAQESFAELYRKKFGLDIVCTRSFNHTGVGQTDQFAIPSFCKQVARIDREGVPGTISVGNLSVSRDFSDVRDVVRIYRLLLENENHYQVYNVGSGVSNNLRSLLDYIISLSKTPIHVVQDPSRMRPADIPYLCCDNTRIKEMLQPRDIRETLREMFLHYRSENENRS